MKRTLIIAVLILGFVFALFAITKSAEPRHYRYGYGSYGRGWCNGGYGDYQNRYLRFGYTPYSNYRYGAPSLSRVEVYRQKIQRERELRCINFAYLSVLGVLTVLSVFFLWKAKSAAKKEESQDS